MRTRPAVIAAALLAALALIPARAVAATPTMTPHRAVYDLELDPSKGGEAMNDVTGRLVFETSGTNCDGWTVNTRFVTRITGGRGSTINDLRSATWEAADGSAYRFVTQNFINETLSEETNGIASRFDDEVSINLREPEQGRFSIGKSVLFPTQHVQRILAAAIAGEKIVTADIFDGSETGRKVYATSTVIGPRREPAGNTGRPGDDVLGRLASWIVTIGYFDTEDAEATTPSYEFTYDLFENGVSREITLDYGDFTLVGELSSIEFLDQPACGK
ncbi:uncharacterized protein DUF1849 [Tepidamorphus gemmatus]|uniref:Uncharacterized protein DUF1849 n=1 Tax=Tepidamorphus gemmatus TaxID=747076 RepID=A0A4R3MGQ6_9HYPH|nr:cell envelope integrity EipB family protein [Tepidamorphus gemmatus]TCT12726.1 uncharacterized protein DUF1849 [Tepidamorphus gemmatus]